MDRLSLWAILFGASIICYYFISCYLALIVFAALVYSVLASLHIIGEVEFNLGSIRKSVVYFKKHTGAYKDSGKYFQEAMEILKKFKLQDNYECNTFGMYYDDPKTTPENECRYVVGIMSVETHSDVKPNKELEDYLLKEQDGWFTAELPYAATIISRFDIHFPSLIFIPIIRYYKALPKKFEDKEFLAKMKFDPKNIPGILEICRKGKFEICIPTKNDTKFELMEVVKS